MVISRTPLRISFFGGGTDYPVWYEKRPGTVISTSINKYLYITCRYLPPFFKYNFRIRYTKQEHTKKVSQIMHPSARECLKFLQFSRGVEIQHNADLPANSGLGSSSAFTVGLLNALFALKGKNINKVKLAKGAIFVEQNLIKENVGSQDQTVAAYGGLNRIDFGGKDLIKVHPLLADNGRLDLLQNHLMLFFTGFVRNAPDIAKTQIKATKRKTKELEEMFNLVGEAEKVIKNKKTPITEFGKLLAETWKLKKALTSKISNGKIDEIYRAATAAGATGGKLLGAGGGGFMLFFAKPSSQKQVKNALRKLLYVPFKFENTGSQIIYKMPNDN